MTYYDPARDYQTGQMRATASAGVGVDEAVELPMVIDAGQAKALAEGQIARRWAERDSLVLWLSPDFLTIEPGERIATADGAIWRVRQARIEGLAVRVELSRVAESLAILAADPGTHLPAPDRVAAPTAFAVLDLPDLGTGRRDVPVLHLAACRPVAGWRQVPFEVSGGGEVRTVSSATSEAIVGTVQNVLGAPPSEGFDDLNSLEVQLADGEQWLESRDDRALELGANLAAIGSELVQFGRAIPNGAGRFRLEHLLRGRRGTEWATTAHAAGEAFVLVSAGGLQEITLPPSAIGTSITIRPMGLADDEQQPMVRLVTGENMRPPSPVDLAAGRQTDGGLSISWTGRSRLGWSWPAGSEPPLDESSERYRVTLQGSDETFVFEALETQLAVSPAALGEMTGTLTVSVVQIGDFAESRSATLSVTI